MLETLNIQRGAAKSCWNSNWPGQHPHVDINSLLLCNHHYNRCVECEHALNVNSGEVPCWIIFLVHNFIIANNLMTYASTSLSTESEFSKPTNRMLYQENWSTAARETSTELYDNVSNLQHIQRKQKMKAKQVVYIRVCLYTHKSPEVISI